MTKSVHAPASLPRDKSPLKPAQVAVVVVSYNSAAHLPRLLESLDEHSDGLALRVIVVDNNSTDDSVAVAEQHKAIVVPLSDNLGYAGAINVGRRLTDGCDAVLVANADVEMEPAALRQLYSSVMASGGVAVPNQLDQRGVAHKSIRREPTILRQLGEALLGDHLPARPAWAAMIERDRDAYTRDGPVDWATGALMMTSSGCDRIVGDWQDDYFLYSEEVDYARRVREAGFTVRFESSASIRHRVGGSGRTPALTALEMTNRLRYFARWHRRPSMLMYGAGVLLEALVRARRPGHRLAIRPLLTCLRAVVRGKRLPPSGAVLAMATSSQRPRAARMRLSSSPRRDAA